MLKATSRVEGIRRVLVGQMGSGCLRGFALVLLIFFGGLGPAFANITVWETQAAEFTEQNSAFTCNSCHGDTNEPNLTMKTPSSVPYEATSVPLSLGGVRSGSSYYRWWYQSSEGEGRKFSTINNSTTASVDFDRDSDSITVRSCLLDANSAPDRLWNCEVKTITRDARVNAAPQITSATPANQEVLVGSAAFSFTVTATDDISVPEILVESSDTGVVTVDSSNSPTFSLAFVGEGDATITITASDTENGEAMESFNVRVNPVVVQPVNQAPEILSANPGNMSLQVSGPNLSFDVAAQDDNDTPSISVVSSMPAVVQISQGASGIYTLIPGTEGSSVVSITATDSMNLFAIQEFTVSVVTTPPPPVVNMAPTMNFVDFGGGQIDLVGGDIFTVLVNAEDERTELLNFSTTSSNPAVASGSFSTPDSLSINANNEGLATITLTVTDDGSLTARLSVDVVVASDNALPQANQDSFVFSGLETTQLLDVLSNDSDGDGDALSISLDSAVSSSGNELTVQGTSVAYTVSGILTEADTFSYKAQDTSGATSSSAVVTVTPSDEDGDGIVDVADNCPLLPNPEQANLDSDSEGDLCDIDPDNDGRPGIAGIPLASGRTLVEAECLTCHLTGTSGAPLFQDDAAWNARIAAAGGEPEDLLGSVLNGRGAMQPFANRHSTQDLIQAILYLSGRENKGPPEKIVDRDLDGVADDEDNCPNVPNTDQANSDNTGPGDVCEPLADRDGDGYNFNIDDDDGNANRLIAVLPRGSNNTIFTSDSPLMLGRVASAVAMSNSYQRAAAVLSDAEFAQGVSEVFAGVNVAPDTEFSSLMGITNLISTAAGGRSEFIIQLNTNVPLNPVIRLFDMGSGLWSSYVTGDDGQLATARATNGGCPNSNSANYQNGLISGLSCVRVSLKDGGMNDADGIVNGSAEVIANIASGQLNTSGTPATVDTSPSKSGGGAVSLWCLLLLAFALVRQFSRSLRRTCA